MSRYETKLGYETESGQSIYNASRQATVLARTTGREVEFLFNGISLRTTPTSNPDDIAVIYDLKCQLARASKQNP